MSERETVDDEVRRDALISSMAREIVDGDLVGVGLGTPLAVAAALLARASHAPDSHVLVGGAVDPNVDLAGALSGSAAIAGRTSGYVPHVDTMEMAERQAMTLQFVRPAQVDARGQTNVSAIIRGDGRRLRLPGGLALADVPALLPRLVVFLPRHRRRSLVATVDRVTGGVGWHRPPHVTAGVVAIVSDLAVIRIEPEGPRLQARMPGVSMEQVVEETGFELRGVDEALTYEVSGEHRAALAEIDPDGVRFEAV